MARSLYLVLIGCVALTSATWLQEEVNELQVEDAQINEDAEAIQNEEAEELPFEGVLIERQAKGRCKASGRQCGKDSVCRDTCGSGEVGSRSKYCPNCKCCTKASTTQRTTTTSTTTTSSKSKGNGGKGNKGNNNKNKSTTQASCSTGTKCSKNGVCKSSCNKNEKSTSSSKCSGCKCCEKK